ncbi:Alginate O-acetyl transferase AlgF [Monaibacterium marinum]|uniref:Alginate biosynthesis protein AlgF n=2 Tax=Pontivivens marinum TaxID=1690039 RepID=A0A2C9CWH5_9RHOB|nr:Alginate O-acetyl transferase AlgF [Monaibacterium marinum]
MVLSASNLSNVDAGLHYTVIPGPDGAVVIAEPVRDPSKVLVSLYNLGSDPVSLQMGDGSVEIIPPVAAGAAGYREVNPLRVPLAVFTDSQILAPAREISLRRGEDVSFIAQANGNVQILSSGYAEYDPK